MSHQFIFVATDEVTKYSVIIPLYRRISHKGREALTNYAFYKYGHLSFNI